ncbi:MAG TPA: BrnT family toxin [Azospirillum sp.]
MGLEWDDEKSARNASGRGLPFDVAVKLFDNSTLEWDDRRWNYGERRICVIGQIGERCFTCVYTWRNGRRRIISLRKASPGETHAYRKTFLR